MIALTISDLMEPNAACLRLSELITRAGSFGAPDAICIRNDSFSEEPFASMTELVGGLWDGKMILESEDPSNISKAVIHIMGRRPIIIGANSNNLEQFAMVSKLFDCPLCISAETTEELLELSRTAESMEVADIYLDPMLRNMKQCLESCTELTRLAEMCPEAAHPVAVRTWSGEYAMTMATVSLLVCDALVITDDLDQDSCETLGALIRSVR